MNERLTTDDDKINLNDERKFRELVELLVEGIFESDLQGNVTYANSRALECLGLDEKDLEKGLKVFDVVAPQDRENASQRFGSVVRGEDVGASEYMLLRKDGTTFPALVHSQAIIHNDVVTGVRGILFDISERKQFELALQESERKYRELTDLLDEGVYEIDYTGRFLYANRRGLSYLQVDESDIENGLNVFDIIIQEDMELAREKFQGVLNQEDVGSIEYRIIRKDGTILPVLTHSSAVIRGDQVTGIRGVAFDISELKQAEAALLESERKYRELTDLLDEGVFEIDTSGRITYANRRALSNLRADETDIEKGLTVLDIIAPEEHDLAKAKLAGTLNREDTGAVEFTIIRKDGTSFPALAHGSAIMRDDQVVGIRGVVFDISELKAAERALEKSEQRYSLLLDSLHEGIWVLNENDMTTFVNPRMAEMLGYTEEEMLGKPVYAFTSKEQHQNTADFIDRRKRGISEQSEVEMCRKDGSKVYALLETSPILDDNGGYTGWIAGAQDITERKLGEEQLKQTMAELDRSNQELEQFAYATSHDLREPLRMVTSFVQSLEKKYKGKLDETADEYIHFIVDGAARMQRLIDDILQYSRVSTRALPFEKVNLEEVLETVLNNLGIAIQEARARITHDPLPVIIADSSQMGQVLQNLISNAIKFAREGETPAVHISARQGSTEWLFSVKDNGIGIEPELFDKVFVIFQRLNPAEKYPGTGIGLAVTKKIVERHGGRIWPESEPGKGTAFYFTIPLDIKIEKDAI